MKGEFHYISRVGAVTIVGTGLSPDYYKDEQLVKVLCVMLVMETTYDDEFKLAMLEYLKTHWSYDKFKVTMAWIRRPNFEKVANWCPIVCGHNSWSDLINWLELRISRVDVLAYPMEEILRRGGVIWEPPLGVIMTKF